MKLDLEIKLVVARQGGSGGILRDVRVGAVVPFEVEGKRERFFGLA